MPFSFSSAWGVLGVSALACFLLARLFSRRGWCDASEGTAAARKLQGRPVPPVGGAALLLGLLFVPRAVWEETTLAGLGPWGFWGSLLGVFLVGTVDDLRRDGLAPWTKLALLALALLPFALDVERSPGLLFLFGLVALNVANTFDNADGALASVALAGFLLPQPWIAAALLGFLPMNLDAGARWNRPSGAPTAYLGDAGSFVLGFLVLVTPAAWPLLWIPPWTSCGSPGSARDRAVARGSATAGIWRIVWPTRGSGPGRWPSSSAASRSPGSSAAPCEWLRRGTGWPWRSASSSGPWPSGGSFGVSRGPVAGRGSRCLHPAVLGASEALPTGARSLPPQGCTMGPGSGAG